MSTPGIRTLSTPMAPRTLPSPQPRSILMVGRDRELVIFVSAHDSIYERLAVTVTTSIKTKRGLRLSACDSVMARFSSSVQNRH